jgi:hypothetical protein
MPKPDEAESTSSSFSAEAKAILATANKIRQGTPDHYFRPAADQRDQRLRCHRRRSQGLRQLRHGRSLVANGQRRHQTCQKDAARLQNVFVH